MKWIIRYDDGILYAHLCKGINTGYIVRAVSQDKQNLLDTIEQIRKKAPTAEVKDLTGEAPETPKKEARDKWVISSGARGKYLELYLRDYEKPIVIAIPQNDFDFILAGIQTLLNGKKTDELDKAITSAFGNTFPFSKAPKPSPEPSPEPPEQYTERIKKEDEAYTADETKGMAEVQKVRDAVDRLTYGIDFETLKKVQIELELDLEKRVAALEAEFNGHEDRINRLGQTPFTRYSKTFTIYEHEDRLSALEKDSWNKAMHKDTHTQIDAMIKEIKDLQAENKVLKKAVHKLRKAVKK